MAPAFSYALWLVLAIVVAVLALGLVNMLRADSQRRSQSFMRARVVAQMVAIIVILVAFYVTTR